MKRTYTVITCDNPNCKTIIKVKYKLLTEWIQAGSKYGIKLLDFCSEKCQKETEALNLSYGELVKLL